MTELKDLIKEPLRFKVLVVDDKVNMRRTLRNMLRLLGFCNFVEADDGDVAIQRIKNDNVQLIVCDWNMPRMSGLEVLRFVRSTPGYEELPFLMITSEMEESAVAESVEAEVDAYISKPFVPKTLEDKVIEILNKKINPPAMDLHLRTAAARLKAGDFKAVRQELGRAAEVNPRSPRVHHLYGLLYEAENRLDLAEKSFLMAKEMGPKFIRAHEKLAEIYERQGRSADMLKVLKEAVKVSPKNAERQTKLGQALLAEGRLHEAKTAFASAVSLDPYNPSRQAVIGEAFLAQGLSQEAEKAFKASIQADPNNIHVYNRLGIAFRRQKKFTEAAEFYLKALKLAPEEERLHYNLARTYFEAGLIDLAVGSALRALGLRPDFSEARDLLEKMRGA